MGPFWVSSPGLVLLNYVDLFFSKTRLSEDAQSARVAILPAMQFGAGVFAQPPGSLQ
jgi:hypothetical protein